MYTIAHIATWIVVGLIGGSIAGAVVNRQREGFGLPMNIALGCGGAVLGGAVFWLFDLFPSLDTIAISLRDIVAAVAGSFVVILALWFWKGRSVAVAAK
jgi:uncharacterized membrane protein YeaQ/YmgE (transglycosylase-associated protein family)